MPARRCTLCGINYPVDDDFRKCPVHREQTDWVMNLDVTKNWDWLATVLAAKEQSGAQFSETPPVVPVKVTEDTSGRFWISSNALIQLGLTMRLPTDFVLHIPAGIALPPSSEYPCDAFWEVMGYRDSTRSYWVRPLRVPNTIPEDILEDIPEGLRGGQ